MLFSLTKLIQEFFYPYNIAFILLLISLYGWRKGRTQLTTRALILSITLLFGFGLPFFSHAVLRTLENAYPSRPIHEYPQAPAIVVLGGTMLPVTVPRHEPEEVFGTRVLPAVRLFRHAKSSLFVVTSGVSYETPQGTRTEADDMADLAVELGVPRSAILIENRGRNTYESSLYVQELLQPRNFSHILLVTSAFHMKRAVKTFEKQGFTVTAVPTSHQSSAYPFSFRELVPSAQGLSASQGVIKELLGFAFYALKP